MKPLSHITSKFKSYYEAGKAFNVNPQQLRRLVDKGALYSEKGEIYIPSKTKLILSG